MAFLPDGRHADHRAAGPAAGLRQRQAGAHAAGRRAQGPCQRPGRAARCLPASPTSPRTACSISPIRRRARAGRRDHGGAGRAGRRRPARRRPSIFEALPRRQGSLHSRLAHRLRPRRADVCHDAATATRCSGRRISRDLRRQDRAAQGRRLGAAGQSLRRPGRTRGRRSSPGAIAIRRAWRCIPRPAGSGRSSTGRSGGDELNILKAGANYGWPRATHGIDYDGSDHHQHKPLPGMEDPLRTWVPSISPCGLCFYTGDNVPGLEGLAVHRRAVGLRAVPDRARRRALSSSEERLIEGRLPYIRDVRQGPDGLLYLVTHSDDGGLFRLEPA